MESIGELIREYGSLVSQIPGDNSALLKALVLRARINNALEAADEVSPAIAEGVTAADCSLKEAKENLSVVQVEQIEKWRKSLQTSDIQWWWSTEPPKDAVWIRIFRYLLWVLTAISLVYLVEILRRQLGNAPDALSVTLQGMIGLLAVGTLAQSSKEWLSQSETTSNTRYSLAGSSIAIACILFLSQDFLGNLFAAKGTDAFRQGNVRTAIAQYERALRFDPEASSVHYSLGKAYQAVLQYDAAEAEYRIAAMSSSSSSADRKPKLTKNDYIRPYACGELSALLVRRGQFAIARQVAEFGLKSQQGILKSPDDLKKQSEEMTMLLSIESEPGVLNRQIRTLMNESTGTGLSYCLHRDLSRTCLELSLYDLAYSEARSAISARSEAPAAHYLLAQAAKHMPPQVLKNDKVEVADEYQDFIRLGDVADELESSWTKTAMTELFPKNLKKP